MTTPTHLDLIMFLHEEQEAKMYSGFDSEGDIDFIVIDDEDDFVSLVKHFKMLLDVEHYVSMNKSLDNESGQIYVKVNGIKFGLFYHDLGDKQKIDWLLFN